MTKPSRGSGQQINRSRPERLFFLPTPSGTGVGQVDIHIRFYLHTHCN
ncbi:MAG: hypothetical protein P8L85_07480 [Rubripirellula sp.]|nr:hypothetical protein [Rubripirellula sp.]